jgi:hypothetical protein
MTEEELRRSRGASIRSEMFDDLSLHFLAGFGYNDPNLETPTGTT